MPGSRVFVSYSHEDERWVHEGPFGLVPWLAKNLRRRGVQFWYDPALAAHPDPWRQKIKGEIDAADFAMLLISQDFLVSDFIQDSEIPWIRERVNKGKMSLLPVLVGPVDWEDEALEWISRWQMLRARRQAMIDCIRDIAAYQNVIWGRTRIRD